MKQDNTKNKYYILYMNVLYYDLLNNNNYQFILDIVK